MQKHNYKKQIACTIFALLICLSCFGTVTASAEEVLTVSETTEHVTFVTFKKSITENKGNILSVVYYLPNDYYSKEYDYGVVILSEEMVEQYNLYGDYFARKEAEGIPLSSILYAGYDVGDGRLFTFSVSRIPDSATDTRIIFVFFVRNERGEVNYKEQVFSSFNEIGLVDPTNEELLAMATERDNTAMDTSFGTVVQKIAKLVDLVWIYLVIAVGSVAVIWGAYIGIRIIIAKRKEEQINAKGMVKRFLIGIIVMFVLSSGLPLLIKGLSAWAV